MIARNEPIAFHHRGLVSAPIRPRADGPGRRLPARLVVPPGDYTVHGRTYRLQREGLYRFLWPPKDNQQRIVHAKDPLALLSAIAWLTSHGSRDNGCSLSDWLRIARRGKLIVTCGSVARFGVHLLSEQGLPARVVQAKTLERLNTYDNGHVLVEAWLDGRWTLVDLDVKVMFRAGGRRLSLLEFSEASQTGDYEFERLSAATAIAVGCFVQEGYDYGLFMESAFCNEERVRLWYRRIMMVPILREGDRRFATGTPSALRKAAKLYGEQFTPLSPAECIERFYRPPGGGAG